MGQYHVLADAYPYLVVPTPFCSFSEVGLPICVLDFLSCQTSVLSFVDVTWRAQFCFCEDVLRLSSREPCRCGTTKDNLSLGDSQLQMHGITASPSPTPLALSQPPTAALFKSVQKRGSHLGSVGRWQSCSPNMAPYQYLSSRNARWKPVAPSGHLTRHPKH